MTELGKSLVIAGLLMVMVGVLLWTGVGRSWLGRLPGDIHYSRGNFTFYFPLMTCVLVRLVLMILLWFLRK